MDTVRTIVIEWIPFQYADEVLMRLRNIYLPPNGEIMDVIMDKLLLYRILPQDYDIAPDLT